MKRYLVVDDDELSCRILQDYLSEFADCDIATSGKAGYRLFEEAIAGGRPYDLICSDVIMPELDGHGLVSSIRAREASLPFVNSVRTRIFMISSSGSPMDMTQAILDNDCDDYIVKPFHRETLKAMLVKYGLIDLVNEP